ncbi:MAG: tRNA 2-selenouridine(34) synthase MnmH [Bdellovibrionales bacterium]|nr:tRNA 2-selenouridine(34) synthase MnmH [Bdellovibrionales bacterium]
MKSRSMIDLDRLLTSNTPLIDVRAPVEFEEGHFPASTNLPILENEDRRLVGTCYRERGAEAAIHLGHELVSGKIRFLRTQKWISFLGDNSNAHLYCHRGGMRSGIATEWIREAGFAIPRIEGGYKALRNHILMRLSQIASQRAFLVLGGKTGSGKTEFLREFNANSVDLEALACHRGSSFGGLGPQPSQATFENALTIALMKLPAAGPVLLEDESVMIGSIIVPEILFLKMKQSPMLLLEVGIQERVLHLIREYVLKRLLKDDESADQVKKFFLTNLSKIQKKLGGLKHSEIEGIIRKAFDSSEVRNPETHGAWVKELLVHYYDPLYEKSLARSEKRILIRGDRNELASKLPIT